MVTTAQRQSEMDIAEFTENAERGILDERLDAFVPPGLFGPPTKAELAEAQGANHRTEDAQHGSGTRATRDHSRRATQPRTPQAR